jgi:hypothetical protein
MQVSELKWPDPGADICESSRIEILMELQDILWGDADGNPDPDKEWDASTIEQVAEMMTKHGLKPKELSDD